MEPVLSQKTTSKWKNWITITIIALYFPYLLLYLVEVHHQILYLFEGVPAILAVLILLKFGNFSRQDLLLRWKHISRAGVFLLFIVIMSYGVIGLYGTFRGFFPYSFFIVGPLSAITQELYFRGSLQAIFEKNLNFSRHKSNILQNLFFIGWHLRLYLETDTPMGTLVLILGFGYFGLIWGYQSRKDGSLLYVLLIHIIGLMGHSLFIWILPF